MQQRRRNEPRPFWAVLWLLLLGFDPALHAGKIILELKNGDRITGQLVSESTNTVTVSSPFLGTVNVPVAEISKRETVAEPAPTAPAAASPPAATTNAPPPVATTNEVAKAKPPPAKKSPKEPIKPANPEAQPIASTPSFWKHDIRFGINLRYSTRDSQEFSVIAKSTYGKAPYRHIFDGNFRYGEIDGRLAANSLATSEKTEYQFSKKGYVFNLVGGGYDEVRNIDLQFEVGPGVGVELLKLTNFVWKSEAGVNFQKQYRSDNSEKSIYSVRLAEIFAWRIWENLTADAKIELFPNVQSFGEYRLRLESTLRYPVSKVLSLNLDVIDLYDTEAPSHIPNNDLQIRSSIGLTF